MPMLFDPRAKSPAAVDGEHIDDHRVIAARARDLRDQLVRERRSAGEHSPESVPVVNRKNGELRWFNLALNYPGNLDHAESLLKGRWRLATKDEEAEEVGRCNRIRKELADAKVGGAFHAGAAMAAGQVLAATERRIAEEAVPGMKKLKG